MQVKILLRLQMNCMLTLKRILTKNFVYYIIRFTIRNLVNKPFMRFFVFYRSIIAYIEKK